MSVDNRPLPGYYSIISGGTAGVTELLIMYPLDTVKTRMQLKGGATAGANNGVFSILSNIVKTEGPLRLYKGLLSPIFLEMPKRAIKFSATDEFRKIYGEKLNWGPSPKLQVLSGISAGVLESFLVTPFELVKIKLQDPNSAFKGPKDVISSILKSRGVIGMATGLEATMWRQSVWNAGYFGSISHIKSLLPQVPAEEKGKTLFYNFIAGTIGGTIGSTMNIPFDVVKSRIQLSGQGGSALSEIFKIAQKEGVKTLFSGWTPKILRLGPGGGVLLVVFDQMMGMFREIHYKKI
ncbi:hypothetical protein ACO0QE_002414 [Hanseniaspora vineae]